MLGVAVLGAGAGGRAGRAARHVGDEGPGLPTEDHGQILADLSVEHAGTLDHYRAAHQISVQAQAGTTGTENLRLAMLHFRAPFSDLLGQPPGPPPTAAVTEPGAEHS